MPQKNKLICQILVDDAEIHNLDHASMARVYTLVVRG